MILKVYDVNQITGNVLYRPMINYINKKVEDLNLISFPRFDMFSNLLHLGGFQDLHWLREQSCRKERDCFGETTVCIHQLETLFSTFIHFDVLLQNSVFPYFSVEMPSADEMYQLCQNVSRTNNV